LSSKKKKGLGAYGGREFSPLNRGFDIPKAVTHLRVVEKAFLDTIFNSRPHPRQGLAAALFIQFSGGPTGADGNP